MSDRIIKIVREYAIILAQRGVEEFKKRAEDVLLYEEIRLHQNGLPTFWFLRKKLSLAEAKKYIRQHPPTTYIFLRGKEHEYLEMEQVFLKEREEYIEMTHKQARKLLRFEQKNDPGGNVYY